MVIDRCPRVGDEDIGKSRQPDPIEGSAGQGNSDAAFTGLGAAILFDDTELTPIKGQLVYMPPDPAVDYMSLGGGGQDMLYMFPRSDVILLGGTYKMGDYSTNPEPAETERIVAGHQRIYDAFDA